MSASILEGDDRGISRWLRAGVQCHLLLLGPRERRCRPLIRLAAPTGVEPRASTRPSDPRKRGEGTCRGPLRSHLALAGHVPSPRQNGERVRVRGSH
ncbi:hypothetical protein ELH84_03055 [Rhizobium ruizarguesonis]|nr:hypothetical protein ELH84_03055 [Rhizobium ruizarguesonis]